MMTQASVDDIIAKAVSDSLRKNFGDSTARSIEFYFDSGLVSRNPKVYERMLRKTFKAGADHMIVLIEQEIFRVSGAEAQEGLSLEQVVAAVKRAQAR
ncbi:MAG: hypothetical protein HY247_00565 [archaeon]|nr:MAG: hypothetical protein HY247_00565 [archaeon]